MVSNDTTSDNFPDDYQLSDVDERVRLRSNAVINKVYGKDVRLAMKQGIEISSAVSTQAKELANASNNIASDLKDRWDNQVDGKTDSNEVIDARQPMNGNAFATLNERIQAGVDVRALNVKAFGVKGDGSTDDTQAISNMIATLTDGSIMYFPAGKYIISQNIGINKRLNIIGVKPVYLDGDLVKGSVISGAGLYFQNGSSGSSVDGIGVITGNNFANSFDIHGIISGIRINNAVTIARDHGFLIESYNGLVEDIKVSNSEAYDGTHGFISKASQVTFENCLASDLRYWGFGVITDNIPGASMVGAALHNHVNNSRALRCGVGFSQYKRNYFGSDESKVPCLGNQFSSITAEGCNNSLVIGDTPGDTGSGQYTTFPIDNTSIIGFTEINPKSNSRFLYSRNLNLDGFILNKDADLKNDGGHNNPGLSIGNISGSKMGTWFDIQPLDTTTAPSLKYGSLFRTQNSNFTTVNKFSNIVDGRTYSIVFWDDQTKIVTTADGNIKLQGGDVYGRGNGIVLRAQDGYLFELSRTTVGNTSLQLPYKNATNFEAGQFNFIEITAGSSDDTSNLISVNNPASRNAEITIFIRSTNGSIRPSGFDPNEFVIPDDDDIKFVHSLGFGTGLMTKWTYVNSLGKYVLVNKNLSKYTQ